MDQNDLRTRYLIKSKQHHPDFFVHDDTEYEKALEITSLNNKAFAALSSKEGLLQYILELHGQLEDVKNSLPPEFLMEMMDLNERLMDAKLEGDDAEINACKQDVHDLEAVLDAELEEAEQEFDQLRAAGETVETVLERLKDIYLKRKYLRRLWEGAEA